MINPAWLYGLCALVGAGMATGAQEWRWQAKHSLYVASVDKAAREQTDATLLALWSAGERVKDAESKVSAQREENAKTSEQQAVELDRLNRCLKSGTCGLRVAAKCPATTVPAAGNDSASRDPAAGARLEPAAESDYLEFRRRYKQQLDTLKLCKVYGESQSKKPSLRGLYRFSHLPH